MRPDQLPYEARVEQWVRLVREAQRLIAARVQTALEAGHLQTASQQRMQLAAVLSILDQHGAQADPEARALVNAAWTESAERTATLIGRLDVVPPQIPGAFAGIQREALQALEDTIVGRLRISRQIIGRTTADLYQEAGLKASTRAILGAAGSPRAATVSLAQELLRDRQVKRLVARSGVGFIDRAGRGWKLDTYAEMAVRTTTRQAVVQGAVARMVSHGVNLARVSMHASSCPICKQYEGRLVSLDGSTSEYEGEAVMDGPMPPYHPRCAHSLAPVAVRIETIRRELAAR